MTAAASPAAFGRRQGVAPLVSAAISAPAHVQLEIRRHRRCAPEHASLVRRACLQDRSVLPRWHQDDRGPKNAHRGHHEYAEPGEYAGIPAWNSREHWLTVVVPLVLYRQRETLRKYRLSPEFFREACVVKSGYAQMEASGRRCIVRPDTLASVLGVTERHVQSFNACLREIGLEVVVREGRMLKFHERDRYSRQRGLATEVALTVPAFLRAVRTESSVDQFTPFHRTPASRKTSGRSSSLHGLTAERKKEAAPPPHLQKRWRRKRAARHLAADVISAVPWCSSERPGRLAGALMKFATAPTPWTGADVANAITTHTLRTGRGHIDPDRIRTRPAALLASILRELDVQADHPGLGVDGFDDTVHTGLSVVPVPCTRPDCDGHGWLPENEHGHAVRCPECPPEVHSRSGGELPPATTLPNGEPPF